MSEGGGYGFGKGWEKEINNIIIKSLIKITRLIKLEKANKKPCHTLKRDYNWHANDIWHFSKKINGRG